MRRSAFTLMEILVTILILGFVATGLPMILSADLNTREDALVQEALYASTAKMSQILSYKWDEQSNQDATTISGAKVLDVLASTSTDPSLDRNNSKFRKGHFKETGRRSLYDALSYSTALGDDNDTVADDIDDTVPATFLTPTTTSGGYKANYTIAVTTNYIVDISADNYVNAEQNGFEFDKPSTVNRTNIKRIQVDVLDEANQRLFTMRTYSSNIGESSISSRIFN